MTKYCTYKDTEPKSHSRHIDAVANGRGISSWQNSQEIQQQPTGQMSPEIRVPNPFVGVVIMHGLLSSLISRCDPDACTTSECMKAQFGAMSNFPGQKGRRVAPILQVPPIETEIADCSRSTLGESTKEDLCHSRILGTVKETKQGNAVPEYYCFGITYWNVVVAVTMLRVGLYNASISRDIRRQHLFRQVLQQSTVANFWIADCTSS